MKSNSNILSVWDSGRFLGTNKSNGYVTVEKEWFLKSAGITSFDTGGGIFDGAWPPPDRHGPWRYFQDVNGTSIITAPASGVNATQSHAFNQTGGWNANDNNWYITFNLAGDEPSFTYNWSDDISTLQAYVDAHWPAGALTVSKVDNPGVEQSIVVSYDWQLYLGTIAAAPLNVASYGGDVLPNFPYYESTTIEGEYNPVTYTSVETEVPNIKSVSIDRSIDTDAGSCTIVLYNSTAPSDYGETNGPQPGYFSYNRGNAADAQARWGHVSNDWNNVLVPMALLRTYEGYGGYYSDGSKLSYLDALESGAVVKTGTWFVDSVSVGTDGLLSLKCRDAAKLLIEQLLYPPLIPQSLSPLKYFRWKDETYTAIWDPGAGLGDRAAPAIPITFGNSSMDVLRGTHAFGFALPVGGPYNTVLGTSPAAAADSNETVYSIGHGFDSGTDPASRADWWEFDLNADINRVYVSPWGGGYTCYVSVSTVQGAFEAGVGTIPYVAGTVAAGDVTGDSQAAIGYVASSGLSFEGPTTIELPQIYSARRIRITLMDQKIRGGFPPNADTLYRSGLREVAVARSNVTAANLTPAIAAHYLDGYWIISANGQVFPFGRATDLTDNNPGILSDIVSAVGHPSGNGFWAVERGGKVHAFGAAQFYGDPHSLPGISADFVDIAVTHTGEGYWVMRSTGGVYTYGDAQYMDGTFNGNPVTGELPAATPITSTATAIAGHPTAMGYWITDALGRVGNFGAASNLGEVTPPRPSTGVPSSIIPTATGDGYWILWGNGQVFNYEDATRPTNGGFVGGSYSAGGLAGLWVGLARSNSPIAGADQGYWGLRLDGFVGYWNSSPFGRPGQTGITRTDGNYFDYSDIVKDLLGWAGFTLTEFGGYDLPSVVGIHGTIESTGVYSEEALGEDLFDKKPVIEAIRTFAEIVGYITWVDEDGGFHFQSPNWWGPGNFYEDGSRISYIPEIDEERQLFDYSMNFSDDSLRSEIIISNQLPTPENNTTITNRYIPPGQDLLRGMVRPAIWVNEVFNRPAEQQIMAELIGLHIWFSQREGNTTCVANPCIQINDQVRIWERVSAESYIHYVRGINTNHDFDSGEYIMTLTTNWLGNETDWVISTNSSNITPANNNNTLVDFTVNQNNKILISPELLAFLGSTGSEVTNPNYFAGFTGGL